MYQGTPYAVEQDLTAQTLFIASMMHAYLAKPPNLVQPDVTCPTDAVDNDRRNEVVHHEEVPGQPKHKKSLDDKQSTFTFKAKSIPVTPRTVAASTGSVRERCLVSIYKEIENFLLNIAMTDADPALVIKFRSIINGEAPT